MVFHSKEIPDSIDRLFVQVVHLHRHRARMLFHELDLHRGQPRILRLLWEEDGQKQKDIAEQLQLQPATVTRMLQRMEKTGFIHRKQDEVDMRVSRIYLTERGRKVKEQLEQRMKQLEEETYAGFNDTELSLMNRFLQQMWHNLSKYHD